MIVVQRYLGALTNLWIALRAQPAKTRTDLSALDLLRGLAALYVVCFHASVLTWENADHYTAVTGHDAAFHTLLLSRALEFGKPAVLLFFLISGFCIHYRQATTLVSAPSAGRMLDIRVFAVRRVRRLYPPFLFAVALTALLDAVGASLNPALYAGESEYWRLNMWQYGDRSFSTLFGNLLMQSALMVPPFGSNGALWSLAYEFWFYALYPIFVLITVRFGTYHAFAIIAPVGLAIQLAVKVAPTLLPSWLGGVLLCWIIWCAGALLAEAYAGRVRLPGLEIAAAAATLGLALLVARRSTLDGPVGFQAVAWGVCLTILLGYFLLAAPRWVRLVAERAARSLALLGVISYSLYLVHLPWLTLLAAWWLAHNERLPAGWELFGLGVMSSVSLGAITWLLVERWCVPRRAIVRHGDEAQSGEAVALAASAVPAGASRY
jgi:peptidoglycan/LPS O-acetylase OafA/YrhL